MRETGGGFATKPTHNRDAAVAKNHQRVVGVSDDAGKFGFQNLIQQCYCRRVIEVLI